MSKIMDLLTKEEIVAFETRIDEYGAEEYGERKVSGEYLLRFWDAAKSQYLLDLFGGDKLILSKEVALEKNPMILHDSMRNIINNHPFCRQWRDLVNKVWNEFVHTTVRWFEFSQTPEGQLYDVFNFLMNIDSITSNIYKEKNVVIVSPEGKEIKIQSGCKTMRAIGKIAQAWEMDMAAFEDFRIKVSQVLNQKKLTGELCLSIHPLDYSTMSDNDSNWDSCMSWKNRGCYRQGTIEMMNSPMVVVAYLNSSTPMTLKNGIKWSNKKWRELFIINEDIITNIKSYPYNSPELTKITLDWLKELADTNSHFNFHSTAFGYTTNTNNKCDNIDIYVNVETCFMYNDFYNDPYGNIAYFKEEFFNEDKQLVNVIFNYSGESECMGCGQLCDFCDGESRLMGECCDSYYHCEYCERTYMDEDELFEVDGRLLCPDCIEDYCCEDTITGVLHLTDNMNVVSLVSKKDPSKVIAEQIWIYNLHRSDLKEYFTKLHKYVHINRYLPDRFVVYLEECTEEGLQLFNYDESLTHFDYGTLYTKKVEEKANVDTMRELIYHYEEIKLEDYDPNKSIVKEIILSLN